jgi:hypothetical protein
MGYSNISAILDDAQLIAITNQLHAIEAQMPFLITLDKKEIQGLFKLGKKSAGFVQDALNCSINFPDILPAKFNTVEFKKDANLFLQLSQLAQVVGSLNEKIKDTLLAVGSEAMGESVDVYSYAKTGQSSTAGLKVVVEQMKQRFKKTPSKKGPE